MAIDFFEAINKSVRSISCRPPWLVGGCLTSISCHVMASSFRRPAKLGFAPSRLHSPRHYYDGSWAPSTSSRAFYCQLINRRSPTEAGCSRAVSSASAHGFRSYVSTSRGGQPSPRQFRAAASNVMMEIVTFLLQMPGLIDSWCRQGRVLGEHVLPEIAHYMFVFRWSGADVREDEAHLR